MGAGAMSFFAAPTGADSPTLPLSMASAYSAVCRTVLMPLVGDEPTRLDEGIDYFAVQGARDRERIGT